MADTRYGMVQGGTLRHWTSISATASALLRVMHDEVVLVLLLVALLVLGVGILLVLVCLSGRHRDNYAC